MYKKVLSLVLALTMVLAVSGCSKEEVQLLDLLSKASTSNQLSTTSVIEWNVDLPKDAIAEMNASDLAMLNAVTNGSVKLDYSQDYKANRYEMIFRDSKTDKQVFSIFFKDNALYVETGYILEMLDKYLADDFTTSANVEQALIKDTISKMSGTKYLKIDSSFIETVLKESMDASEYETIMGQMSYALSPEYMQGSIDLYKVTIDNLIMTAYKNFDGRLVSAENGGYKITLNADKLLEFAERFALYTIDNIDAVTEGTIAVFDQMPESIIKYYQMVAPGTDIVAEAKKGLSTLPGMVKPIKTEIKEQITEAFASPEIQSFKQIAKDSSLTIFIKGDADKYTTTTDLNINATIEDQNIKFSLKEDATVMTKSNFKLETPASNEAKSIMDVAMMANAKALVITKEDGGSVGDFVDVYATEYTPFRSDYTSETVAIKNNSMYISFDLITNFFGESVENLESLTTYSGNDYVKVRDLEKLGYEINFDASTGASIIVKR